MDTAIVEKSPFRPFSERCQAPDRRPWYVRRLASALDFRILGPFEVLDGERELRLGGIRQRSVLAILVLRAGETVSSDRLVDELWGDEPPADAQTALQQHVSRLRKQLEPHAVLLTRAPGYALDLEPGQIDLERFRALREQGREALREGRPDEAATILRSALALWRGPPLSDLANEPFVAAAARELEDEQLSVLESRIEADLACGRHAELVGELTALVRAHPLRERPTALLMIALYRSGRQADALEAYSDARQTLVAELGLEPGPELQALQQSILTHDESLRAPRSPATRRRRRWLALAATAVLSALVAAIVATAVLGSDEPAASVFTGGGGALLALDSASGSIERRLPAGRTPSAVAVGDGAVWMVDADARTLLRVVPSSRVVETLATGATPTDVAFGAGSVWVANGSPIPDAQFIGPVATAVARLDPSTRTERGSFRLRRAGKAVSNLVDGHVAVSSGAVWAVAPDFSVVRFDPVTRRVTATTRALPAAAVATGPAGVWVLGVDGSVARLDERSGRVVRRASVPSAYVGSIAVGDDSAWVTGTAEGKLWRIRAGRAESVGAIDLSPGVGDLAVADSGVWVANPIEGTLSQVNPDTGRVVRTIDLEGIPRSLAVDGETLWVAVSPDPVAEPNSQVSGVSTFPSSVCERVLAGADGAAEFVITADLPLQGGVRVSALQMNEAIAFVLREHGFRAGRYRLAYQLCDDSVARTGLYDEAKCASNARAYAENPDVIGVIGTLNSGCAVTGIPELNRAPNGPLAMVSPLNDFIGLTRSGPGVDPSLPAALYPTGVRNYLRVYPTGDLEGAALALFARDHRWRRVFVLDDHDPGYGVLSADALVTAAGRVGGLTVVGRASWDPRAEDYSALTRVVAESNPDVVYVGGLLDTNAGGVIRELRAALGHEVVLVGPSGLTGVPQLMKSSRGSALGMYLSFPGVLLESLSPAGSSWVERFRKSQGRAAIEPSAVYAAQATEVLLDAIARSDGTRASVVEELFATRIRNGLLGSFGFDQNGDISESPITIVRVQRGGRGNLVQSLDGAPVVEVERPSPELVAADE
jgi:DNA-binding SARP family transcriptional activator/ABC-type branched-subunit amino acid transport system substrate-binding protein/outer membrane protein assembly factor BamB